MLIKTSVLSLSLALFIGVTAPQVQSWPIVQGRHLQPIQQQVDSRLERDDFRFVHIRHERSSLSILGA